MKSTRARSTPLSLNPASSPDSMRSRQNRRHPKPALVLPSIYTERALRLSTLEFHAKCSTNHSRAAGTASGSAFQIVCALKISNQTGLNRPPSETFLRERA